MAMNTVIQEKRRELGLTQEQVAEHMGVSIPAVSKWETGQTCPDISLLPRLARLLKIDLNTLFGFHQTLSREEIRIICDSVVQTGQTEGIRPAFTLAKHHLREFPHNDALVHSVTVCIDGLLNMCAPACEDHSSYEKWVLDSYEMLADSTDPQISNSANFMLASKLIRQSDFERAQMILDRMPDKQELSQELADKLMLQVQLFQHQKKYTEAIKAIQYALFTAVTRVQLLLGQLASLERNAGNIDISQKITEKITEFTLLFQLWEYYSYSNQFQTAVREKSTSRSLSLAQKMFQSIHHPWNPKNTVLFHYIVWNYSEDQIKNLLTALLSSLSQESEFQFLQAEPAFIKLLEEYRT